MAKKALPKDQIVKLIVGAGQASPSPPVGPALGSKGVKSMDFCKVSYSQFLSGTSFPIEKRSKIHKTRALSIALYLPRNDSHVPGDVNLSRFHRNYLSDPN